MKGWHNVWMILSVMNGCDFTHVSGGVGGVVNNVFCVIVCIFLLSIGMKLYVLQS